MKPRLRILLVAPHPLGDPRGNSVTVVRLAAALRAAGARVTCLGPDQPDPSASLPSTSLPSASLRASRAGPGGGPPAGRAGFDVVHAFHATKAGPRALRLAERCAAPCVVTLTGTDVNLDLGSRRRRRIVRRVLKQARALVVFHSAMRNHLRRLRPALAAKSLVIPAGVAAPFFACGAGRRH